MQKHRPANISEKQLEDFVLQNLDSLEGGLLYIDRQTTNERGHHDILLLDIENTLVVLKLSVVENDAIIDQGIDSYDYVSDHLNGLTEIYSEFIIHPLHPPKLFLVAPNFTPKLINRAKWINIPISLFTYQCVKPDDSTQIIPTFTKLDVPLGLTREVQCDFLEVLCHINNNELRNMAIDLIRKVKCWDRENIKVTPCGLAISITIYGIEFAYISPCTTYFWVFIYDENRRHEFAVNNKDDIKCVIDKLKEITNRIKKSSSIIYSDTEINELWQLYQNDRSTDRRNALVEYYTPLVKHIVEEFYSMLPNEVEKDDLYSAGIFGLLDAIKEYNKQSAEQFDKYASIKIKGAVLEELICMDWIPRLIHSRVHRLNEIYENFQAEHGRNGTDEEISEIFGISVEEFAKLKFLSTPDSPEPYHRDLREVLGLNITSKKSTSLLQNKTNTKKEVIINKIHKYFSVYARYQNAFIMYIVYWFTIFIVIKNAFAFTLFFDEAKELLNLGIIYLISEYGWGNHFIWFLVAVSVVSFICSIISGATVRRLGGLISVIFNLPITLFLLYIFYVHLKNNIFSDNPTAWKIILPISSVASIIFSFLGGKTGQSIQNDNFDESNVLGLPIFHWYWIWIFGECYLFGLVITFIRLASVSLMSITWSLDYYTAIIVSVFTILVLIPFMVLFNFAHLLYKILSGELLEGKNLIIKIISFIGLYISGLMLGFFLDWICMKILRYLISVFY